jgi:translocation and assembly module TamB
MLTTPYAKNISVTNHFVMDDNISYRGEINVPKLIGIDAKLAKLLKNVHVKYSGDTRGVKTALTADNLTGYFNSEDFKKGVLHLETIKSIKVNELVELPKELNQTKVNVAVDASIDFDANASIKAKAKITSNVANIDADLLYGETVQIKAVSHLPKESLLRSFNKDVKWDALSPTVVHVELLDNAIDIEMKAKEITVKGNYLLSSKHIDGKIKIGGLYAEISGIADNQISIDTNVTSMHSLMQTVESLYRLDSLPPLEGKAHLSAVITALKAIDITLKSPKLSYKVDRKTTHIIDDTHIVISMDGSNIILKNYSFTYHNQKFFSTKPSVLYRQDDVIKVSPLWINDQLKVEGDYNFKTKQGELTANAEKMHFAHEFADINSNINLKTTLDGNRTSVNGKMVLLGGNIHYNMKQKTFASNSDIVIIQEMQKEEASPFMDNLAISVKIDTKKPLVYKQDDVNIKAKVDLDIYKELHSPLMLLGSVELQEGGTYIFQDKKFVLQKSYIYFAGDPQKPILALKVQYRSIDHLITITITGTPETPNIHFSSSPSLTREQILSIILFDTEIGGDTHSGKDMMKMMGGAMAKSALANLGVKLDYLVLGEGNSVEVGKKLTRKITIIYVNDIVPSVKLKYKHGKRTESVIEMSEESQSYDLIYKMDF